MTRKSPIKHNVRPHERSGVQVHRYERGKGLRPQIAINSQSRVKSKGFDVFFYYGQNSESHSVEGPTMTQAMIQGTEAMTLGGYPTKVVVRMKA